MDIGHGDRDATSRPVTVRTPLSVSPYSGELLDDPGSPVEAGMSHGDFTNVDVTARINGYGMGRHKQVRLMVPGRTPKAGHHPAIDGEQADPGARVADMADLRDIHDVLAVDEDVGGPDDVGPLLEELAFRVE